MKFCKQILKASEASQSLCKSAEWMNYKQLKKLLKDLPKQQHTFNSGKEEADSIKNSGERKFFTFLRDELQKVSKVYGLLQYQVVGELKELKAKQIRLEKYFYDANKKLLPVPDIPENLSPKIINKEIRRQLRANMRTHLKLILLESFAVLNYVGFRKILKKHDKLTGFSTRDKYMAKLVDEKSFAYHPWISIALNGIEGQFNRMKLCVDLMEAKSESTNQTSGLPEKSVVLSSTEVADHLQRYGSNSLFSKDALTQGYILQMAAAQQANLQIPQAWNPSILNGILNLFPQQNTLPEQQQPDFLFNFAQMDSKQRDDYLAQFSRHQREFEWMQSNLRSKRPNELLESSSLEEESYQVQKRLRQSDQEAQSIRNNVNARNNAAENDRDKAAMALESLALAAQIASQFYSNNSNQ